MIWISYYIAIMKDPGRIPDNFNDNYGVDTGNKKSKIGPKSHSHKQENKEYSSPNDQATTSARIGGGGSSVNDTVEANDDDVNGNKIATPTGNWKRWCKKCETYKPERSHHCKTCKRCVLKMDHHCPWTANCVGYANMPHFMRFLFWVDFTTGFVFIELCKRGLYLFDMRHLSWYAAEVSRAHVVWTVILIPLDGFILLTIFLLTVKCLVHIISGMSQIETWEWERIESQLRSDKFWERVEHNYATLHGGQSLPKLTSIRSKSYMQEEEDVKGQQIFSIDDVIFPYDLGFWDNLVDQLNYPWLWIFPWSGPRGNGVVFEKSDLMEEDQLNLPWPPDGGNQVVEELEFSDEEATEENKAEVDDDGELVVKSSKKRSKRKNRDPRLDLPRKEWVNDLGERLTDYGVDLEVEEDLLE